MRVSVVVPTYDEAENAAELIQRVDAAFIDVEAEILFIDDGSDDLPHVASAVGREVALPVRVLRRTHPSGGLSGAVVDGFRAARSRVCIVMDGDLQHPPETARELWEQHLRDGAEVVVASRYIRGGTADGLSDVTRAVVSRLSTVLARMIFPGRLRGVTDPMTGFFLVDTAVVDLEGLRPRGFKILLEVLVRSPCRVAEVPLVFGRRRAGESKASLLHGIHFACQLWRLRLGTMLAGPGPGAAGGGLIGHPTTRAKASTR